MAAECAVVYERVQLCPVRYDAELRQLSAYLGERRRLCIRQGMHCLRLGFGAGGIQGLHGNGRQHRPMQHGLHALPGRLLLQWPVAMVCLPQPDQRRLPADGRLQLQLVRSYWDGKLLDNHHSVLQLTLVHSGHS
jgi:hypothetical protein